MLSDDEKLALMVEMDIRDWNDYDRKAYSFILDIAPQLSPLNWEDRTRRAVARYVEEHVIPSMFEYMKEIMEKEIPAEEAVSDVLKIASAAMFELGFCFSAYYKGNKGYHRR